MMISFIIPGLYEQYSLNFRLLLLMKYYPQCFYDDIKIGACYGNFQYCIFDGGRNFYNYKHTCLEEIREVVNILNNEFEVPARLIFTNNQLKPEYYNNRFGNIILQTCANPINEITIADDNFMNWIHEHYPTYSFISSTTKCLLDQEKINQELSSDKFKMVCLDYNMNKNKHFLESLSPEVRDKVEILINAICPPGCPNRKEHYQLNSLFHLGFGRNYTIPTCGIITDTIHPYCRNFSNNLTPTEIYNVYKPMGFHLMKIEGRTFDKIELALNYTYYMVKDEYKDFILKVLLDQLDPHLYANSIQQFNTDKKYLANLKMPDIKKI